MCLQLRLKAVYTVSRSNVGRESVPESGGAVESKALSPQVFRRVPGTGNRFWLLDLSVREVVWM